MSSKLLESSSRRSIHFKWDLPPVSPPPFSLTPLPRLYHENPTLFIPVVSLSRFERPCLALASRVGFSVLKTEKLHVYISIILRFVYSLCRVGNPTRRCGIFWVSDTRIKFMLICVCSPHVAVRCITHPLFVIVTIFSLRIFSGLPLIVFCAYMCVGSRHES